MSIFVQSKTFSVPSAKTVKQGTSFDQELSLYKLLATPATSLITMFLLFSASCFAQTKPIPPPVLEYTSVIAAHEGSYAFPGIYHPYMDNPLPVKNQLLGDTIAFTTYDYSTNHILNEQIGRHGRYTVFSPMIKKPGGTRMVEFITSTGGVYTRNTIFDSTAGSTGFQHLAVKQTGFYPGTYVVAAHQLVAQGQPNTLFAISADNNPFYTRHADFGWYPAIAWSGDNLFGLARKSEGYNRFKSTDFGQTFIDMGPLINAFPDSILKPDGYFVEASVTASQNGKHIVYYGTSIQHRSVVGRAYAYLGIHPDSCSTVWTLHSSDFGNTWVYHNILIDGTPNIVQYRSNYAPTINELSQIDLVVSNHGVMHVVANGYGVRFQPGTLNTNGMLFPLLYWNSLNKIWQAVSDIALDTVQQIGSTYPGRAMGSAFPSIAIDEAFDWIFVFFTGPQRGAAGLDIVDGIYRTDIYMSYKTIWGFILPEIFAGKRDVSESFAHTPPYSQTGSLSPDCRFLPVLYLEDRTPGVSFLDGTPAGYEPLIYKAYGFGFDCNFVDAEEQNTHMQFALEQNYPNPFNPITEITYSIPHTGRVSLIVYDALGREVKVLVNNIQEPGRYTVSFVGGGLASGIYYYTISAGKYFETKKMILIK